MYDLGLLWIQRSGGDKLNKLDVLPGFKTFIIVGIGIIVTLFNTDGSLNELTPERIQTLLELCGLGTIRLALSRKS